MTGYLIARVPTTKAPTPTAANVNRVPLLLRPFSVALGLGTSVFFTPSFTAACSNTTQANKQNNSLGSIHEAVYKL